MGVDFLGAGGSLSINWETWRTLFSRAIEHGWKPQGTLAPSGEHALPEDAGDWGGDYFSNQYQTVSEEDAENMADALERSLDSLSTEDKAFTLEFIAYIRAGDFFIW